MNSRTIDHTDLAQYKQALIKAIQANHFDAVFTLLETGNPTSQECLNAAIEKNNNPLLQLLLFKSTQIEINDEIKHPLEMACDLRYWDCVATIVRHQERDINQNYGRILFLAVGAEEVSLARLLLEKGAPSHWLTTVNGDRPLHVAIRANNRAMLELLLSFRADLTQENFEKLTPIQLARQLEHWSCIEMIARMRMTDAKDTARYGDALFCAVRANRLITAKVLLEAGASSGWCSSDEDENQCLHVAVSNNYKEMVALLFTYGFDLKTRNKKNQTPADLAASLKLRALDEGWMLYSKTLQLKMIFFSLVQSLRQPASRLSGECIELVGSFLFLKNPTVQRVRDRMTTISINCLLKRSVPGIFYRPTPAAETLLTELKQISENTVNVTRAASSAVQTFFKSPKPDTCTLKLLREYHLDKLPLPIPEKEEKASFFTIPIVLANHF
ncbi:MAG TPA: ankyrin repeat domain-containing protein [Gammaproteobacteria bacterium]|nr:ankyrin repeat domain-containing protein [Gammaproteobacteria bacterium]